MNVLRPNFEKRDGIVTVVVQELSTGVILMVAFTNEECWKETLQTGKLVLYSTSRRKRWMKGESSGNTFDVAAIHIDCDGDAMIYHVKQSDNVACHTDAKTCFYRTIDGQTILNAPKHSEKDGLQMVDLPVNLSVLTV